MSSSRPHNFGCTKSRALGGLGTPGSCWCDKPSALIAGKVNRPARPSSRSPHASANELATDLARAQDYQTVARLLLDWTDQNNSINLTGNLRAAVGLARQLLTPPPTPLDKPSPSL